MLNHAANLLGLSFEVDQKTEEINRLHDGIVALNSIKDPSEDTIAPVMKALGIHDDIEYSAESKSSLLSIFAKTMLVAGAALSAYYENLENQLTEMDRTVTDQLDELEDYEWDFKNKDTVPSKSMITEPSLQTILYLKNRPLTDLSRLMHESEQLVEVANVLSGSLYERISELDKVSDRTSETLTFMRLMKTVDTSRNYLGGRRIVTNFNHRDTLKIAWESNYFPVRSVHYTVTMEEFSQLIVLTRLIVRTIKSTKETLKLSKQASTNPNIRNVKDNITKSLYVPLLLDMVKLKDVYMHLMFDFVRQNKGKLK